MSKLKIIPKYISLKLKYISSKNMTNELIAENPNIKTVTLDLELRF
jgi:hypothetical protein